MKEMIVSTLEDSRSEVHLRVRLVSTLKKCLPYSKVYLEERAKKWGLPIGEDMKKIKIKSEKLQCFPILSL